MKLTFKTATATLPEPVASKLLDLARQESTRKLSFKHSTSLYFAEDSRYHALHPDGTWAVIETGGEWNGVKANDPINKSFDLPVGAWVIERERFYGRVYLTVHHNNGQPKIDSGEQR